MRGLFIIAIVCSPVLTVNARAEADRSTPKSAAVALFESIIAGDSAAVADGFYATDDEQRGLASAMAEMIIAGKKLGDVAKEKFGAAADPIGRGMLDPSDLSKLQEATIKQTADDAATLTVPGQPRPMSFRKQDEQWKLVVTDFGSGAQQNIPRQTRLIRAMADAITTAAADISADKYKTPDEATYAIQQGLHQVMLTFARRATSRSATKPASAPTTAP